MEICKTEDCTGCFACVNVCPKNCISMVENEIGHIYPKINDEQCIECGICNRTCPNNNIVDFKTPKTVYAAWTLDNKDHESCTSGGIGTFLSRNIINENGVVYGCSSDITGEIQHIRVENIEDLENLKGSKYVQSYVNDTYAKAKNDLKCGKYVLFIGTPCQIAGLYCFLGKEKYDNLITVDLICHGVPPQKLLFDHILGKAGRKEKLISFRQKEGFNLKVFDRNKVDYFANEYDDLYFLGFSSGIFYRESCYNCKYAKAERCSDITIGDFWGLGKEIPFKHKTENGVSVVLVNNNQGEQIIEKYKSGLFL